MRVHTFPSECILLIAIHFARHFTLHSLLLTLLTCCLYAHCALRETSVRDLQLHCARNALHRRSRVCGDTRKLLERSVRNLSVLLLVETMGVEGLSSNTCTWQAGSHIDDVILRLFGLGLGLWHFPRRCTTRRLPRHMASNHLL
jgi:hypothetical protein